MELYVLISRCDLLTRILPQDPSIASAVLLSPTDISVKDQQTLLVTILNFEVHEAQAPRRKSNFP